MKMIMIAEWLKLKGITADDKWIRKCTKPKYKASPITVTADASSLKLMKILGSLDCLKDIDAKCISLKQLLKNIMTGIESKKPSRSIISTAKQQIAELIDSLSSMTWDIVKHECLLADKYISMWTDTLKNLTTGAETKILSLHLTADVDSIPLGANPCKESVLTPGDNQHVEVNTTQTAGTKEIFARDILDLPLASFFGKTHNDCFGGRSMFQG